MSGLRARENALLAVDMSGTKRRNGPRAASARSASRGAALSARLEVVMVLIEGSPHGHRW
jgi:hypothetical protein